MLIRGEKSTFPSSLFQSLYSERRNDERGVVGILMLWSLCVCCGRRGPWRFHIDFPPARTAALWRNDNNIHHLTGHLYRQDRTTVQKEQEHCVSVQGRVYACWGGMFKTSWLHRDVMFLSMDHQHAVTFNLL